MNKFILKNKSEYKYNSFVHKFSDLRRVKSVFMQNLKLIYTQLFKLYTYKLSCERHNQFLTQMQQRYYIVLNNHSCVTYICCTHNDVEI